MTFNVKVVLNNTARKWAKVDEIQIGEAVYRVVRLPQYEKDLKGLAKLEVKLHEEVTKGLKQDIESGKHDEIKGTGMGQRSGGFTEPEHGEEWGFQVSLPVFPCSAGCLLTSRLRPSF